MRQENPQEVSKDISMSRWLFESAISHMGVSNKRLFILVVILSILLLASNIGWAIYESQFETVEKTYAEIDQQADGDSSNYNYIIGGDYGIEAENQNNQDQEPRP